MWKTCRTFPLCESTSNPSKLSPTTVISLLSGLIDVCCNKNKFSHQIGSWESHGSYRVPQQMMTRD
jgi:hypothetical protein